jgi:hypothetical protein
VLRRFKMNLELKSEIKTIEKDLEQLKDYL